jgi:hypothetical protein
VGKREKTYLKIGVRTRGQGLTLVHFSAQLKHYL